MINCNIINWIENWPSSVASDFYLIPKNGLKKARLLGETLSAEIFRIIQSCHAWVNYHCAYLRQCHNCFGGKQEFHHPVWYQNDIMLGLSKKATFFIVTSGLAPSQHPKKEGRDSEAKEQHCAPGQKLQFWPGRVQAAEVRSIQFKALINNSLFAPYVNLLNGFLN